MSEWWLDEVHIINLEPGTAQQGGRGTTARYNYTSEKKKEEKRKKKWEQEEKKEYGEKEGWVIQLNNTPIFAFKA